MKILRVELSPPRKANVLANVKIELADNDGNTIVVDDNRILRNREGNLWLAQPTHALADGKAWKYQATVSFSRELRRAIEDEVLSAYERQQQGGAQ